MNDYSTLGRKFIKTGSAVADKYEKLSKSVAAGFGLTVCEIDILMCLHMSHKPHTVRYVSYNTHYSKGMISRCVDTLFRAGYVTVVRDEIDRRAVRISLTDKAIPAIDALTDEANKFANNIYDGLSEHDIMELDRFLTVVANNTEKM